MMGTRARKAASAALRRLRRAEELQLDYDDIDSLAQQGIHIGAQGLPVAASGHAPDALRPAAPSRHLLRAYLAPRYPQTRILALSLWC